MALNDTVVQVRRDAPVALLYHTAGHEPEGHRSRRPEQGCPASLHWVYSYPPRPPHRFIFPDKPIVSRQQPRG